MHKALFQTLRSFETQANSHRRAPLSLRVARLWKAIHSEIRFDSSLSHPHWRATSCLRIQFLRQIIQRCKFDRMLHRARVLNVYTCSLPLWPDTVAHILASALMFVMSKNVANPSLAKPHCLDIRDAMIPSGRHSTSPRLPHLTRPHLLLLAAIRTTSLRAPLRLSWTTAPHRPWLLPSPSAPTTTTTNPPSLSLSNISHIPTITRASRL